MIKPKLHHVTMKTSRLDEMIAWYALVIGARVQFRDKMAAWTTNDAANHRIAFLAVPGLSDDADKVRHNGMHHCAFEYDSFADLMASFDRLRQARVEPAFCLDHGMTISLYYKDPEGNFVELQSDSFSDWNLSSEWMRTSADFAQIQSAPSSIRRKFTTRSNPASNSRRCRKPSAAALICPTLFPTSVCRRPDRRRRARRCRR